MTFDELASQTCEKLKLPIDGPAYIIIRTAIHLAYKWGESDAAPASPAPQSELVEALKFYSDPKNYKPDTVDIGVGSQDIPGSDAVSLDGGQTARAAIAHTAAQAGKGRE